MNSILIEKVEINEENNVKPAMRFPNPFYLLKIESLVSVFYEFVKWDYVESYIDDKKYLFLYMLLKDNDNIIKEKIIDYITEYQDYCVVYDVNKESKGYSQSYWKIDIIKYEIEKNLSNKYINIYDTKILNDNFIIEKIKDETEYNDRNEYWKNLLKIKKYSKITKNKYSISKYKSLNDDFHVILNETSSAPYYTHNSLMMYSENLKQNIAGILYNLIVLSKINNKVDPKNIHCYFNIENIESCILYIEIVSENTELLDYIMNIFMDICDRPYLKYDIIEYTYNILVKNQIKILNIADYKEYLIIYKS